MRIQKADEGDLAAVAEIDRLSFGESERLGELEASIKEGEIWVAKDDTGSVLAFATLGTFLHGHGFLRVIAVHPQQRRRGVGRAMVEHLARLCPTDRLFTATSGSNTAMQRFAQAMGFVLAGEIADVDEDESEFIYVKRLG